MEIKPFVNLEEFEKVKKVAEYFVEQRAFPK